VNLRLAVLVSSVVVSACQSKEHARQRCEEVEREVTAAAARCGVHGADMDLATTFDCAHTKSIRDEKTLDAVCLPHVRRACVNGAAFNPLPPECVDQMRR